MSLRKAGSCNSAAPLKKNMDKFHHGSYGIADQQPPDIMEAPSSTQQQEAGGVDDSDPAKKQRRPSPNTASNIILGVRMPVPSLVVSTTATTTAGGLSPSHSYDNGVNNNNKTAINNHHQAPNIPALSSSSGPQQQQMSRSPRRVSPRIRSSSDDNNNSQLKTTISSPSSSSSLPPPFVLQVTAIASLGGVLFGYDMGVIAGALPQLKETFDLSSSQEELVVSILYVGGGLGAAFGGTICDFLGRKPAILWTDITFMVGASILFTAPHVSMVCIGRVVVGFAVAVSGIADVSYLHEIAPTQWRGAIVSVNEACISLGFLLAFLVGTALTPPKIINGDSSNNTQNDDIPPPNGWRYMFLLAGVMAAVQFVGMWTMPESPVWLKEQGRHDECKAALRRINGGDPVPTIEEDGTYDSDDNFDDEEQDIPRIIRGGKSSPPRSPQDVAGESKASYESLAPAATTTTISSGPHHHHHGGGNVMLQVVTWWRKLQHGCRKLTRTIGKYRRQVWIALFLSTTQQFCGQTSVLNYAPTILRAVVEQDNADGDGNDEVSGWATLSIGLVKFVATVLVIWKIESIGRRTLLLVGMGTIAFGLLLVAVAFSANSPYLREKQGDKDGIVQSGSGFYFALPGVLLVVSGYSMSFGPLTWLLTSELFPAEIRGRALGTSTIVTYLCAAMVTYSFLTAQSLVGTSTVFLLYMLVTLVGMAFACLAIPDTGGKTLGEIDNDLSNMPWWRRFGSNGNSAHDPDDEPKPWRRRSPTNSMNGADQPPSVLLRPNSSNRLTEAELT